MTERHKEQAIRVIKNILRALHEKRYEDLPACVDGMEDSPDGISAMLERYLEEFNLDCLDEYIADNEPAFFEYAGGQGFSADYELTVGGEPADLCLQMEFQIEGEGLKSFFLTIDPA